MDGPGIVFNEVRDALGIRADSGDFPAKGRLLQSLPYMLVMGAAAGIASAFGGRFHDGTPIGFAAALGVALLIMLSAALPANRLLRSHPAERRLMWAILVAFTTTSHMDDSTLEGNLIKVGAMIAVCVAIGLLGNRLTTGTWRPPRRRG